MAKDLKKWNGRGHGKYNRGYHIYVAAYSRAHAARLVSAACFDGREDLVRSAEIKDYYSEGLWGNAMDGITPTEPCVYTGQGYGKETINRVI